MMTGKALMNDVRAYHPKEGEMAFWWLGQQSFIVKTARAVFALDPFLSPLRSRLVPPLLKPEELEGVDFVLGSHDHLDHIDREMWPAIAAASPGARFVVPEAVRSSISQVPADRLIGIDDGTAYFEDGLAIRGIAAAHEFLDADPVTGQYPYMSFIIECDGLRIYHAGDTCKYEGLETKLINAGKIDLMFVPINGRSGAKYRGGTIGNMTYPEAVDLVGAVAPRVAVPAHYEMFANNAEDPMLFASFLEAKYPEREFWIGGHGVRVTLPK